MKNTLNKIITFITLISFISSCSVSSNSYTVNNPGPTNSTCKEPSKSFNIKSVDNTIRPNEKFRINILKKNFDDPITITSKYKFPLAETVEHQGVKIVPAVIKNIHHKALTVEEARKKRKELWKKFREFSKEKYKYEKNLLKEEQKEDRIFEKDEFHEQLKLYEKGSSEKQEFIKEQIKLRQELISNQKEQRKDLKDKYKQEIEEFKKYLDNIYPNDKNFSVKNDPDCNSSDPSCDYNNIDGLYDETIDFDYLDTANSFQYDNTYVDGNPYSFSTQSQQPITTENPEDYELGDSVEYAFSKQNVDIGLDNCTFDNVEVKKQGDKVSFNVKSATQGCDFKSMTFRIQGKPDSTSCGQENESRIEINSTNGYVKKDIKTIIQLSIEDLFKQETILFFIDVITRDGKEKTINVSEMVKPTQSATFNDVRITTDYTVDKIYTELFNSGKSLEKIEEYINNNIHKYRMAITGVDNKAFKFVITDDSTKPDSDGNYPEIGKVILGSECLVSTKSDSSNGYIFYLDRTKFSTGKYNIFLLDKDNNLIPDSSGKITPKHSFFIGNLTASTYSTNADIIVNSEESRLPSEDGKLSFRNVNNFTLNSSEQETINNTPNLSIEKCSLPIRNTNININDSNISTYQNYVFNNIFGTSPSKKYDKFINFSYPGCRQNKILIGGMVDLTNPDPKLNWKMFNEKRSVLMSLTIEDEKCEEIKSFPFSAKVGSVHFINKALEFTDDPTKGKPLNTTFLNTKACENKTYFIKIKKAFDTSRLQQVQKDYSLDNTANGTTDGKSVYGYDFFSYVSNTFATDQSPQHYGTKLEINKCQGQCQDNCKTISNLANPLLDSLINDIKSFDYSELNKFQLLANTTNPLLTVKANMNALEQKLQEFKTKINNCSTLNAKDIENISLVLKTGTEELIKIVEETTIETTNNNPRTIKDLLVGSRLITLAERIAIVVPAITASVSAGLSPTLATNSFITYGLMPINLAKNIDNLIVNYASKTLTKTYDVNCKYASQGFIDITRATVRFSITSLKNLLNNLGIELNNSNYSNVESINNTITNAISKYQDPNPSTNGSYAQINKNIDDSCKEKECDPNKKNEYIIQGLQNAYGINDPTVQNIKKLIPYLDGKTFGVIKHKYDISSIVGVLFADSATYLPPNTFPDLTTYINTAISKNNDKCILKYLNEVKNNAPNERNKIKDEYYSQYKITEKLLPQKYRENGKDRKVIAYVDYSISYDKKNLYTNSGNTLPELQDAIKSPEEYNVDRRFDVSSETFKDGTAKRKDDSEVKIFEYIARLPQYNVYRRKFTIPSLKNPQQPLSSPNIKINSTADGVLIVYSAPLETCYMCRNNLFEQFREVMPNVVLVPIQPN